MEVTAVVLFKGSLAYYSVSSREGEIYVAHLLTYSGEPENYPPQRISFEKQGRHCIGSIEDRDLMDDICDAARDKFRTTEGPIFRQNP